jgi:hypothetical protein
MQWFAASVGDNPSAAFQPSRRPAPQAGLQSGFSAQQLDYRQKRYMIHNKDIQKEYIIFLYNINNNSGKKRDGCHKIMLGCHGPPNVSTTTKQHKKQLCKKLFDTDSDSSLSDSENLHSLREQTPRSATCNNRKFDLSSDEDEESLFSRANTSICTTTPPRSQKYRSGDTFDHNHFLNEKGKSDSSSWRSPRSSRTNLYLSDSESDIDQGVENFEENPVYLSSMKPSDRTHIDAIDLALEKSARRFRECISSAEGGSHEAEPGEGGHQGLVPTAQRDPPRLVGRLSIQSSVRMLSPFRQFGSRRISDSLNIPCTLSQLWQLPRFLIPIFHTRSTRMLHAVLCAAEELAS